MKNQLITCKNCGHKFKDRYCNHCGQSANTNRIDAKFLWEDIEHGIIHYDKGITYTLKQLFLKPGYVIRDYINGKRVHHFRPISLCIVLATIYALLYHFLDIKLLQTENDDSINLFKTVIEHYYWFVFITIPLYTVSTFITFRPQQYNFWEYFIFEAFKVAQRLFIHILFLPVIYFINEPQVTKYILILLMFLDIGLIIWTNLEFFSTSKRVKVFYLSFLSYIIYIFLILVLLAILMLVTL